MFLPPEDVPGVGDGLTGKDGWTYLPPEIITSGGALAEDAGAKLTIFSEAAGAELTTFSRVASALATTATGTRPIILALGRFIPPTVLAPGFFVGLGACAAGA